MSHPPKIPYRIVAGLSQSYHRSPALGDLEELYQHFCREWGVRKANRWYWRQALRSIPHSIHNFFF